MPINTKPIDFLMCEGASDASFISLYIERKLLYVYDKTASDNYHSSIKGVHFHMLIGKYRDLLVCSCSGCTNIKSIFDTVVLPSIKSNGVNCRIIVIIDRDNKTDEECKKLVSFPSVDMSINAWATGEISGDFIQPDHSYNQIKFKSYFSVIPDSSFGSFENVLIDSVSNSEPNIYNEVSTFFDNLSPSAKTYISKPRLEIKAKLDTMITLMDPERVFMKLSELFSKIDLDDVNISNNYCFLLDVVNQVD